MARRNDHSTEELTQMVLTETSRLLEQQPASELSLRKIAKLVGYAPSTLVNLFSSFNNLLLVVNGLTLDEMFTSALNATEDQSQCPQQSLQNLAFAYLEFALAHPHRWQLVFDHAMPEGLEIPEQHQKKIDRLFKTIELQLTKLRPELPKSDIEISARVVWASIHGITQLAINDKLFVTQGVDGRIMLNTLLTHYLTSWLNPELKPLSILSTSTEAQTKGAQ